MSGVQPPGERSGVWQTLGDLLRRVRALEATEPGSPTPPPSLVGTPPLTLIELSGGTTVASPIVGDILEGAYTVSLGVNEGIRVERLVVDGGSNNGAYAYLRQISASLLGNPATIYDLTGTWEVGQGGTIYNSNSIYTVGDQGNYFRFSDEINVGADSGAAVIDQIRVAIGADSNFTGRDWEVTMDDGVGSLIVDHVDITGGDSTDLDGLQFTLAAAGSAHAKNKLSVSAADGDATALEAESYTTGAGTAFALRTNSGNVEISLVVGEALTVKNHLGAAIFEVREDGTIHIPTGGTIVADL